MRAAAGTAVALLACAALLSAALRVVSPTVASGPLRVLAAFPVAVATAVVHALVLGVVGWGSSAVALAAAAAGTWLLAVRVLPRPQTGLAAELRDVARRPLRAAVGGGLLGLAAAPAAWSVWQPHPRGDSLKYHLPEAVRWVDSGRPGVVHEYLLTFPVGAYPVTHEVVLTWLIGTSGGFVLPAAWGTVLLAVVGLAGWTGARALGADPRTSALTAAAVLTLPAAALQAGTLKNDLAAVAFFACAAALLSDRRRPGLLPFAVLALALSVGVKSTGLVLGVGLLVVALRRHRAHLRAMTRPLLVAAAVSVVVGGSWYLRNLVLHGSPFWPLVAAPWGDPVAPVVTTYGGRFLDDPVGLATEHGATYLSALGGGAVLLAGAALAPLVRRTWPALLLSAGVLVSLLVWGSAAFSGPPRDPALRADPVFIGIAAGTTRYLLPALVFAALGLAAAAARGGRWRTGSQVLLAAAVVWNLQRLAAADGPEPPPLSWLAVGVVAGALAAGLLAAAAAGRRAPVRRAPGVLSGAAALLLASALAAPLVDGFWGRHARLDAYGSADVVRWLSAQPDFRSGDDPVSSTHFTFAPFAGHAARHRLELVPRGAPCDDVERRARSGWLVLTVDPETAEQDDPRARGCLTGHAPVYADERWTVYRTGRR